MVCDNMLGVEGVLDGLEEEDWYDGQIAHREVLPEEDAVYGEVELHPKIRDYLGENDIRLYSHQARAVRSVKDGDDVIITTPTASGKTLVFNIPVFEELLRDPEARALYIYPTKALSNDQLTTLKEMDSFLGSGGWPGVYDGDTPRDRKVRIRNRSKIILTNPYGLHYYLPWHEKWSTVFQNLKFIVLDEVHNYRGVFGSNVSHLLHRLLRLSKKYGSDPQIIMSSATIANPQELSKKLTGRKFTKITDDGSESGEKHFIFWDTKENPDYSPHMQASALLRYLVQQDLQTLCFTVSRRIAELVSRWAGKDDVIKAYRAGYLPKERRKIEKQLKNGSIKGVASTNALELGIDIGNLDSVIISGYPGTITSTWQQAGRAGRNKRESLVFLMGFENPLDQYFMRHPEKLFDKPHEHAIIDTENPKIVMGHLACAAHELPIRSEEFKEKHKKQLQYLTEKGLLKKVGTDYYYTPNNQPHQKVRLNNISGEIYEIKYKNRVLETMDTWQAYREAHQGAVLLHQGDSYIVEEFSNKKREIKVEKRDVEHYTEPISTTEIQINETRETQKNNVIKHGGVRVSEHYTAYRTKNGDEVLGIHPLELPPIEFDTEGMWIEIPNQLIKQNEKQGYDPEGSLHAVEHAMISMTPYHAMCDRWDIGGVSSLKHRNTDQPTIFIYDAYQGGIGITKKCYQIINKLTNTTHELINDCNCQQGCPSCIYSPKCGNNNNPLDKHGAKNILNNLKKELNKKQK
ncbi:Distinct helicase family with a unique C-terminal domain including a metal-binding cluster [Methanonatronarchaeum thermophilum]|uniref:Distinct helicase family with a unique C-terminal domain including a metal-binding cluster n=1 Tax=Methanonatronarchaeum thermophilum TaxID=1927129 RepID=A0A1Y3GA92_9EURY|nr:DEAD/DEAH box helicase [Methanonatronarchaeum thermophilum]OUJ18362.1 Distinct helicase family with a unique C-terminal domain including a metal-binding cluster [Methanonatronarchaeum thermophilum]